ncbi:MAG: ribosomal-processing cysteine protease Prp [Clostridia bacterium]|nr:ribosomal-processing cysteine protease Prp [Oscillospiraceae bacterium]MBQ3012973.1 ribosomal-processing cysteine protease Prp [Clostridia bacterium]MBR3686359.1 ribosomal-processing cysteine protease Prp [Clostridia bacterium]MBR4032793.1 ribosomal-processing cysteine protease Prp [Clostridia bacterium]
MTKLVFFRTGGVFYGFEEQGHTGYGEEGDDVLCAALSAMTMLIINTVEVAYASSIDFTIDEETTNIKVRSKAALPEYEEDELKRYAVSGIFLAYYKQIEDMLEEYYDYLDVSVVDRPYEDD